MLKQNTQTKEVHGEKTSCYLSERDERKKKKPSRFAKLRNIFGVNRDKQFGPTASAVPLNHDRVSSGVGEINNRHRSGEVG